MMILYLSAELVVTDTTASGGIISIVVYLCVVALVLRYVRPALSCDAGFGCGAMPTLCEFIM
jgi:hypothetical protein